jgi:hypothetical protein
MDKNDLRIGDRTSEGDVLVLGGHNANLYRKPFGTFILKARITDEEIPSITEKDAMESYNFFNTAKMDLDHVSKIFNPWYERTREVYKEKVLMEVPSSRDPKKTYSVRQLEDGEIVCECEGFVFRHRCSHVELVKRLMQENP